MSLPEKQKRIRHLRVSNYGDVVPKVPCVGIDFPPFTYKHAGVHLQLYKDRQPRFSYPKNGNTSIIDTNENIITPILPSQLLHLHSCDTYVERLGKGKDELKERYVEDLYADETFVGEYRNV
jgi:hypothetical protein